MSNKPAANNVVDHPQNEGGQFQKITVRTGLSAMVVSGKRRKHPTNRSNGWPGISRIDRGRRTLGKSMGIKRGRWECLLHGNYASSRMNRKLRAITNRGGFFRREIPSDKEISGKSRRRH